ncbi:MAG: OsmC family protein [Bacteroidales bacterium]|nr:OsmC family protein [Bacteroidales bacterium]
METYSLTYLGNLRVKSVHNRSGNEIITDAPVDNEGKGEAFSPTDLVCASFGSCMITVLGIIANRSNINIEGLTAHVSKTMESNPRRIKEITVELNFPANNYSKKEKDIFERAAHYCPVALSLHEDIIKTIKLNF